MSVYSIAGVYKIENKTTGECYIGQSTDVLGRWRAHIREAWSAKPQSLIAKAIKKEGPEWFTFTIIERFDNNLSPKYLRFLLKQAEGRYVQAYDSYKNGYNRDNGGNLGRGPLPEQAF